jgi:hypothetical protein
MNVYTSNKTVKKEPKKEPDACSIIKLLLGDGFEKGALIKIRGYEEINDGWRVEDNWVRRFKHRSVAICKGDLVWQQVKKLAEMKDKEFKMTKIKVKGIPVVTIWRVY